MDSSKTNDFWKASANYIRRNRRRIIISLLLTAALWGTMPFCEKMLFFGACRNGDIIAVEKTLQKHPDWINCTLNGYTPLGRAVSENNVDLVKVLARRGANLETGIADFGQTPLHFAINCRHSDMVAVLLHCGANPLTKTTFGETPLIKAAENGDLKSVKLLLKHGAPVNVADSFEVTPLYYAARHGDIPLAKLLISYRADVNAPCLDDCFRSRLSKDEPKMVAFLSARGAKWSKCAD